MPTETDGPLKPEDDLPSGSPPAVSKSIWGKAKSSLGDVTSHASKVVNLGSAGITKSAEISMQTLGGALETGKQVYTGSKLESAVNYLDGELDQRGAKKAFKGTTEAVVGKLDQVTGKRLVELLEERLRMQDTYNDVLATRLAEALDRIAKLEARSNEH